MSARSAAASGYLGFGRNAFAYLVAGSLAIAVYGVLGPGDAGDAIFVAIGGGAVAAVLGGIRQTRPAVRSAWLAVAASLGFLAVGNLTAVLSRAPGMADIRGFADIMFFAAYLPLFVAAYRFGRGTHRSDRTVLLDSGIVALAALPIIWELIVEPNVPETIAGSGVAMALAIPVVDALLIGLVAPLLLLRSSRTTSAYFLVVALALMGIGDTLYAIGSLQPSQGQDLLANLSWLGSYVLLGAAALVPSARELGAPSDPLRGNGDIARLAVTAIALLVVPLVQLIESQGQASAELMYFAAISVVISVLVIFRLQRTIGELAQVDRRFRRFMSHPNFLAVIKDAAGRYVYMNPGAESVRRIGDLDWFGRTDAELFPEPIAAQRAMADDTVRRTGESLVEKVEAAGRTWHTERFFLPGSGGSVAVLGLDVTDHERASESVRFQARLLESVRDAVIVVDREGVTQYWNKGAEDILGFTADEMVGNTMLPLVAAGMERDAAVLWEGIQRGSVETVEWFGARADGSEVWLDARVSPLVDDQGRTTAFLAVAKDVTARKAAQLELARLGGAIDRATDGVILTDVEDRIVYVNPAFERITGHTSEEVHGRAVADVPGAGAFARALAKARNDYDDGWRGDVVARRRDGADLICETTISPIVVEGQAGSGFVTIQRDVTRERAAEKVAERRERERALIAETLSTLRAGATPEVTAASVCSQIVKVPEVAIGSVIMFDVDGGATVLGQVHRSGAGMPGLRLDHARSEYLRTRAEAGPWVERWAVDDRHPYRTMFAELDIRANAYAPLVVDGEPIGVLVSGSDLRDSIDRMTERLPALVEFAAITATLLAGAVADRRAVDAERGILRGIIDARAFEPVFQPIVELDSGEVRGYEALTRFADGTSPEARFEEAHRVGMSLELERACLQVVFDASGQLPPGPWLNVNVSPELVLAGMVEDLLPAAGRAIVLEITEHQAITDYESFRHAMEPMRDRVTLAVDDAGAGFSSLRHIVELAPAMVKLDRSLVAGIAEDSAREAVVTGMVRFAESAGHMLLAEGVETRAELAALRRIGVQLGQGYLLGRPASVSSAEAQAAGSSPRRARPSGASRRSRSGCRPANAAA